MSRIPGKRRIVGQSNPFSEGHFDKTRLGTFRTKIYAPIGDPRFDSTCVGYFLRLAKDINHRAFTSLYGTEANVLELAKSVSQIIFEHNLIIVVKGYCNEALRSP